MKPVLLFFLLFPFYIGCTTAESITVHKRIEHDLASYKTAYIDVQHDDYKNPEARKHGPDTMFVEGQLVKAAQELGLEPIYTQEKAGLKVKCLIRHGWGKPRITIDFNLKTKYITWVTLQLIDQKAHMVIGEVEYNRPRSETNPDDLYVLLFKALLSKPEAYQSITNPANLP